MVTVERFGPGPWVGEPDEVAFLTKARYEAFILRHFTMGHLCGYVAVPERHYFYLKSYDDRAWLPAKEGLTKPEQVAAALRGQWVTPAGCLIVHGGVTFGGRVSVSPHNWVLGFDCGHSGGLVPDDKRRWADTDGVYRTFDYVEEQCEQLAAQLKEFEYDTP